MIHLYLLLEIIEFSCYSPVLSFSAFFSYNPLDIGVPQESIKNLQPSVSVSVSLTESGLERQSYDNSQLILFVWMSIGTSKHNSHFQFPLPKTSGIPSLSDITIQLVTQLRNLEINVTFYIFHKYYQFYLLWYMLFKSVFSFPLLLIRSWLFCFKDHLLAPNLTLPNQTSRLLPAIQNATKQVFEH